MKVSSKVLGLLIFTLVTGLLIGCDENNQPYKDAQLLFDAGQYEEAAAAFETLGEYKDASEKVLESRFQTALRHFDNGDYDEASACFKELQDYKDAVEKVEEMKGYILYDKQLQTESGIAVFDISIRKIIQTEDEVTVEVRLSGIMFALPRFDISLVLDDGTKIQANDNYEYTLTGLFRFTFTTDKPLSEVYIYGNGNECVFDAKTKKAVT